MSKIDSFAYQYTLLMRNADEYLITGMVSCHDLEGTRRLAKSALQLRGNVAFVDIHHYTPRADELEGCEPVERVSLDTLVEVAA